MLAMQILLIWILVCHLKLHFDRIFPWKKNEVIYQEWYKKYVCFAKH